MTGRSGNEFPDSHRRCQNALSKIRVVRTRGWHWWKFGGLGLGTDGACNGGYLQWHSDAQVTVWFRLLGNVNSART